MSNHIAVEKKVNNYIKGALEIRFTVMPDEQGWFSYWDIPDALSSLAKIVRDEEYPKDRWFRADIVADRWYAIRARGGWEKMYGLEEGKVIGEWRIASAPEEITSQPCEWPDVDPDDEFNS
jgi:hypothetical protein